MSKKFQIKKLFFRYPKVSNRRGVQNSRGGWKKYQKQQSGGGGGGGGNSRGLEKIQNFKSQRWLLKCFFLSFSDHENQSIRNICVYSKSKIKTNVTSKQNLEYFKIVIRRLFIDKFCDNSKMLLQSSWAIFIRALVFSPSPRANLFSFEHLCFSFPLIFQFILIQYTRVKIGKQLYYHKD